MNKFKVGDLVCKNLLLDNRIYRIVAISTSGSSYYIESFINSNEIKPFNEQWINEAGLVYAPPLARILYEK